MSAVNRKLIDQNMTVKRKRSTPLDNERKIQEAFRKKFRLLQKKQGDIEFIPPMKNHLNHFLFHSVPLARFDTKNALSVTGTLKHPVMYFIPAEMNKALQNIYKEFKLPENLEGDMTFCCLNMYFGACDVPHTNDFYSKIDKADKEFGEVLDFLLDLKSGKKMIRGFTFDYSEPSGLPGNQKLGPIKSKKFKTSYVAKFMEKVLSTFEQVPNFDMYKDMAARRTVKSSEGRFRGHKNEEKNLQSYYSWAIFDYLRKHLYSSALEDYGDEKKFQKSIMALKKKYSRRKLYWFIGELMILSGLMTVKVEKDREEIIDNLKKKLEGVVRANKMNVELIERQNSTSRDGTFQAIPFHELF